MVFRLRAQMAPSDMSLHDKYIIKLPILHFLLSYGPVTSSPSQNSANIDTFSVERSQRLARDVGHIIQRHSLVI